MGWGEIIGGVIGGVHQRMQEGDQRDQYRENADYRDFQFKNTTQVRVDDAKKAGLHPLYALGAQVPNFSPITTQPVQQNDWAAMGQGIDRAIGTKMSAEDRELYQLNKANLAAQIGESDARKQLLEAEAFKARQESFQSVPVPIENFRPSGIPIPSSNIAALNTAPTGMVQVKPPDLPTSNPGDKSAMSGNPPGWRKFALASDLDIWLPGEAGGNMTDAMESMEDSILFKWMVYEENRKRQGDAWADKFAQRYFRKNEIESLGDWLPKVKPLPKGGMKFKYHRN